MKTLFSRALGLLALCQIGFTAAFAWDYEGHRMVNQLALATLPADFPAFVRTPAARERIAYLSGDPDRWRNVPDELPLSQLNGTDHYLDLEELEGFGLSPQTLPIFRYDFAARLAVARAAHPERFAPIDETRNKDHSRELIGFLPWAIVENCGKLRSGFATLKAFEQHGGTPEEIANAQQNVLYIMGVMGHYVGDAAQPLHTTIYHHGWLGANPHGYTTNYSIHSWIDGGYLAKTGGLKMETMIGSNHQAQLVGNPAKPDELFRQVTTYILAQHNQVEPLYQLYKEGKLSAEGGNGLEGRAFLEGQLARGGQMLGNLWYSAWQLAPEDNYLKARLADRAAVNGATK